MAISERLPTHTHEDFHTQAAQFFFTWTPRIIVAAIAGYYSLGVAYEMGIMAAIDRVAISVLKDSVGYAGLGAAMPTFQWYSAWGVRMAAAAGAGIVYDLSERLVLFLFYQFKERCCPASEVPATSAVRV